MLVFTYGSNMNINRLCERVPSATKVGNAYLPGYVLTCNKVSRKDGSSKANITPSLVDTEKVWGVLFNIEDTQKADLDGFEGLGHGYNEAVLSFFDADSKEYQAQVYLADPNSVNENLLPFDWYRDFILTGALENNLPEEYIEKLRTINFSIDIDTDRRKLNYRLMGIEPPALL